MSEDGSTWAGMWAHDQPVPDSAPRAFAPAGPHPQLHVEDLLVNEPDAQQAAKGAFTPCTAAYRSSLSTLVRPVSPEALWSSTISARDAGLCNVFMTYNTELRQLYDKYTATDLPWLHNGSYTRCLETRACFGLLSMQLWQMAYDAGLVCLELPMALLNAAMCTACAPAADVAAHRAQASAGEFFRGVWALNVPDHSPFRVRMLHYPGIAMEHRPCIVCWTQNVEDMAVVCAGAHVSRVLQCIDQAGTSALLRCAWHQRACADTRDCSPVAAPTTRRSQACNLVVCWRPCYLAVSAEH